MASPTTLRRFLHARRVTGLALGFALIDLEWRLGSALHDGVAILEAQLRIAMSSSVVAVLRQRLQSISPRRRPHATTEIANDILRHKDARCLTHAETARRFVTTASTLRRWDQRRSSTGELRLGPAQLPMPPVRRFGDAEREAIRDYSLAGFSGKGGLSASFGSAGVKVSPSSVGRIRMEIPPSAPDRRRCLPRLPSPEARTDVNPAPTRDVSLLFAEARELHDRRSSRRFDALRSAFGKALSPIARRIHHLGARRLAASLEKLHGEEQRLLDEHRILHARLACIRPLRRPRHTPAQRAVVLAHKHFFVLSDQALAGALVLHENTVGTWNAAVDHPDNHLVVPDPPIDTHGEAIDRAASSVAKTLGIPSDGIPAVLERLCDDPPPRQARSWPKPNRTETSSAPARKRPRRNTIPARYPNDCWSLDLTALRCLFGLYRPYLCVVLDLFSRYPVAWAVWPKQPTAEEVVQLFEAALARHGPPRRLAVRHVLTDQGTQFTADLFEDVMKKHGIQHRLGAVGEHGSIAVVERLWLTLKTALVVNDLPRLRFADFHRRLAAAIDWYARLRPHSHLRGATPHEPYHDLHPACLDAVSPARALPGHPSPGLGLTLCYALPLERRLPYLVRCRGA